MTPAQPTKQNEETWTAPPEKIEGESRAIFQKIETPKKRWNTGMELEYDPVQDLFLDTTTKKPIHAFLDGEDDDTFFDESTEVDPMKFDSDNSTWIKRGGACALNMEKVLGIRIEEPLSKMEKFKRDFYKELAAKLDAGKTTSLR
jgi:hypothetical protein